MFQTAGVPPNNGRTKRAYIGWTLNMSAALRNSVTEKRAITPVGPGAARRAWGDSGAAALSAATLALAAATGRGRRPLPGAESLRW